MQGYEQESDLFSDEMFSSNLSCLDGNVVKSTTQLPTTALYPNSDCLLERIINNPNY